MKHEIAEALIARLASGKDNKGRNKLTSIAPNGVVTDCCLGVLCKLAIDLGLKVKVEIKPSNEADPEGVKDVYYDGECFYLPESVRNWAGMRSRQGSWLNNGNSEIHSLVRINDNNDSFGPVIAAIKEHKSNL